MLQADFASGRFREAYVDQKGFTLIELMITMVVLAFGLLGVASFHTGLIGANVSNENLTIAQTIASGLVDEAKAAGLANVGNFYYRSVNNAGNPSPVPVPYGDFNGDNVLDFGEIDVDGDGQADNPYTIPFMWTRTLGPLKGPPPGTFRPLEVRVYWPDRYSSGNHTVVLKDVIR
jgi:prepilin-type N-terminal cleavage/methylation domain-containing protein